MPQHETLGLRPAGGSTGVLSTLPQDAQDKLLRARAGGGAQEIPTIERQPEAVARRRREAGGAPQFRDNPIGAIGFVLQSIAAGFEGKELPAVAARKTAQQDSLLRQRGIGVKLQALRFGIETCGDLKGEERTACITGIANTVGDLAPDFASDLEATIGTPNALDITKLASHPAALAFLEGAFDTDEERRDFAISEQGQNILQRMADREDRPVLEATLDEIFAGIAETIPEEERAEIGVSPSMIREVARQGGLPDRYKLTENMFDILDREPEILDDRARKLGFMTSKELEAEGLAEVKRESIPEAAKRAGAVEKAKQEARGRELETARTVEPTQDIPLPGGGRIPKGTPITVRPVKDQSFSVTSVFSDGKMVEVEIPDAAIPGLRRERKLQAPTASQIGAIKQRVAFLDDAVSNTEKLIEIIGKTPTGAALELVSAVQGTLDQLFTLAETVPGADGLVGMARNAATLLNERLGDDDEDREFKEQYGIKLANPKIPVIDILEEAIAIALAASSFPSTQRVPVEAIKEARKNVDIGGLFGPGRQTAKAKLLAIISRLKSNREALSGVVGGLTEPAIKTGPARFRVEGGKLVPVP